MGCVLIQWISAKVTIMTGEGNVDCFTDTSLNHEIMFRKDLKELLEDLMNNYLMFFSDPILNVEFVGLPKGFLKGVWIDVLYSVDSNLKGE